MNIGILLPGFSADENDWAIPVQQNIARLLSASDNLRIIALRYPHQRRPYRVYDAQVYPLGVGAWTRGWRRLALWLDAVRLIRRLHRERPFDVLHAMWADETGLVAAWAGRWLGVPVVVSITGGELVGFDDIAYGMQRSAFGRWTVRQALYGADVVTVSGSHSRGLIRQAGYDIADAKIRRLVLGVDTDIFYPDDTPRGTRLLHVGSLVGVKDQAMLLRALARLDSVGLDIIGTGGLQSPLQALIGRLGLRERVRFWGNVRHLDLPQYYRRAALHVMSSRNEGVPVALLEAAACGLPTVSTAVGLLPDHPAMGVTVPPGDEAGLAGAIDALLHDGARLDGLRQTAAATVRDEFSVRHTVEALREMYQAFM